MRIGIDLDGVVVNFTKGWTTHYKEEFGKEIKEEDEVTWGLSKPLTHFVKEADFWNWARDLNGSTVFRNLEPYDDSIETMKKLSFDGHEIVIISSKPWWAVTDTFLWIGENKVPTREVHFTEDKWKIDCDIYLDDAPGQLENYLKNKPNKVIVRFIRPYNKPLKGAADITSWEEFYSLINSMS
jgi:5'(3')-deoxyribonucleotidase